MVKKKAQKAIFLLTFREVNHTIMMTNISKGLYPKKTQFLLRAERENKSHIKKTRSTSFWYGKMCRDKGLANF